MFYDEDSKKDVKKESVTKHGQLSSIKATKTSNPILDC